MTDMQAQVTAPVPRFIDPDRKARVIDAAARLEPIFRDYAERRHLPGLAYGVVTGGELVFSHALGVRDVATQAPADADTVFRIASMTKSFTALAVMRLRDAGKLALDMPAVAYAPELADITYPTGDTPPITVRQLLTMSAGWPQDDPWGDRQMYRTDDGDDRALWHGDSLLQPAGRHLRVLEPGLYGAGAHHHPRVRDARDRLHQPDDLAAVGDDLDRVERRRCARGPAGPRLSLAG